MDVLSFETIFQITPGIEWVTKGAARLQEETTQLSPVFKSTTLLGIQRFNIRVWHRFDFGVEYRALMERESDDQRNGWLGEVMYRVQGNFRVGGGYNFTDFSDNEFSQNDYTSRGLFFRVQGRY